MTVMSTIKDTAVRWAISDCFAV